MERIGNLVGHIRPRPVTGDNADDTERPITCTLIGGGNSGHVCAALIHENTKGKVIVQLLTSTPKAWSMNPKVVFPNGDEQVGLITKISDQPKDVLPNADIILWTGPVSTTKAVFENIRPWVDINRTAIGTIFAQGLVHILATRVFGPEVQFFALRNIPWLCRLTKKGQESQIVGEKKSIEVAGINVSQEWITQYIEPLFVVQKTGKWEPVIEMMQDFCPIVFNPANQIIHPARYWALFRNWTGTPLKNDEEPNPDLYRGMDEVSGNVLEVLDEELQALKNLYYAATGFEGCNKVIPLKERLLAQYGDQIEDRSTLARMVGTNKAYSAAKTPVIRTNLGVMPNPHHRVVEDDIGWGLCVLISIAEKLQTSGLRASTTMMRMLVEWHQTLMGKEYIKNGKLQGRDVGELVLLRTEDALELVAQPPSVTPARWLRTAESRADEHRIGNP
eukprot:gnl/MRDRNA2_/MRDRNA2_124858_c0_seq1.p1 gnl/MRDRNA2_/MRDRNA2_124858_c0~~gnl/MRDRNA2_/MRDRNA2_124858_c0_seq1.p1  ORF type:complete len:447 (+),score=79.44 gnl/MRDRNA2_/MRDRNA2_124858_c0_seq1:106-1446(+)